MKLVAILRIKNQIFTINNCLKKLSELVDEIIIVDNGSTDGTLEIYNKFPKIVEIKKTKGFHEGRDKVLAHNLAKERKPDWILWIDGDEIFEKNATRKDFEKYMNNPKISLIQFRMYNFWLSKTKHRIDGIWGSYTSRPQRQMWRNMEGAYFQNVPFHNGGIQGVKGKSIVSPIRIKHFGFINKTQNKNREKTYKQMSKDSRAHKTLPMNTRGMITIHFFEVKNKTLNNIVQILYLIIWSSVEKTILLSRKFQ